MSDAYIVDGLRTAIGSHAGSLSEARPDDLAALTIRRLLERHPKLEPAQIAEVVLGCANQAGEDNRNVARMSLLLAGLPVTVPGQTVNRLCASGMTAVTTAARAASAGDGDYFIAGGVESMTRAPFAMSKSSRPFGRDVEIFDTSLGWRFVNPKMRDAYGIDSMGQTAENVAEQFKISRADQDLFACRSQTKAATARESGRFKPEITAVQLAPLKKGAPPREFVDDEFIRPETSIEVLGKLRPVFRTDGNGSVTAGNSSGINDGACALLVASDAGVAALGAEPLARVISSVAVGVEPRIMGMGPVPATRAALAKAGLQLDDIAVFELNEAFAAQSLACLRELGIADDDERVNPNGGAIALGHPLGMSGARLLLTAAHELRRTGGRYALCTMCVGVGQGTATIIERV